MVCVGDTIQSLESGLNGRQRSLVSLQDTYIYPRATQGTGSKQPVP